MHPLPVEPVAPLELRADAGLCVSAEEALSSGRADGLPDREPGRALLATGPNMLRSALRKPAGSQVRRDFVLTAH